MYHIYTFFVHSSAYGHLGYFYVLPIVNSAAMSIGVHVSFSVLVFSGYMSSSGIAGSYDGFIHSFYFFIFIFLFLFLAFKGISILSSIVAVSIYIPTNSARGFPFLHTLFNIYFL